MRAWVAQDNRSGRRACCLVFEASAAFGLAATPFFLAGVAGSSAEDVVGAPAIILFLSPINASAAGVLSVFKLKTSYGPGFGAIGCPQQSLLCCGGDGRDLRCSAASAGVSKIQRDG